MGRQALCVTDNACNDDDADLMLRVLTSHTLADAAAATHPVEIDLCSQQLVRSCLAAAV